MADNKIVKRHCKAEHKTRNYSGDDLGELYLEERLRGCASEVLRRFGKRNVKRLESRHYREDDVGEVEGYVRDKHRAEAEEIARSEDSGKRNKKKHHRNTGYDIGVHHRDIGDGIDRSLDPLRSHSVKTEGSKSTDNGSDHGRGHRKNERVAKGSQRLIIRKELFVPNEGKSRIFRKAARLIEGECDQNDDRNIEKQKY